MAEKQKEFLDIEQNTSQTSQAPSPGLGNSELLTAIERLEQSVKALQKVQKSLKRRLTWMAVGSYVRLLLFLLPLILAIVFLPKVFESFLDEYGDLFGTQYSQSPVSAEQRTENQASQNVFEQAISTVVKKSVQQGVAATISEEDVRRAIAAASPQQLQLFFSKYPELRDEVEQIKNGTFEGDIQELLLQIDPKDLEMFF